MNAGTRRRRIRTASRGGALVAVLAIFIGGLQLTGVLQRSHRDSTPAATVTAPPSPIIATGLKAGKGHEWVIKTVPVEVAGSTKKTFGFSLDKQAEDGSLEEAISISEVTAGDELKPGFHATEHPYILDEDLVQPGFGYFVGAPAQITGTVGDKTFTAKMAPSSAGPSVIVFWFDTAEVTGEIPLTRVRAYDSDGKQLAQARVYSEGG
jgi:hypothetical protein